MIACGECGTKTASPEGWWPRWRPEPGGSGGYESVCPGCAVEVHGAPAERRRGGELPKARAIVESAKVPRRKRRRAEFASDPRVSESSEAVASDDDGVEL